LDNSFNQLYNHYQTLQSDFNVVQNKMLLTNHLISEFTHISVVGNYDLQMNIKYIVEADCSLNLPQNTNEGTSIIVTNNYENIIPVYSTDLIYNVFYLPSGGNTLYVPANATTCFTYVKNQTTLVNSWNALLY